MIRVVRMPVYTYIYVFHIDFDMSPIYLLGIVTHAALKR